MMNVPLTGLEFADTPHTVVSIILIILSVGGFVYSFFTPIWRKLWKNASGTCDANGMRKMIVFNHQPYMIVAYITAAIIVSIVFAALLLFVVGGTAYLLLWLVKILLWIIIIIGWIFAVGGVIIVLCGEYGAVIIAGIGVLIIAFQDDIKSFGNNCVDEGFEFFTALNVWEYCGYLALNYYDTFAFVALTPIVIGLTVAMLISFASFLLWMYERIVSKRYNIKYPCPFCHNPSEPAKYLSNDVELPVPLRPGKYGLFYITHPVTKEKMPTMIFNGRDKLLRKCPHCDRVIGYNTGIEKHIAFVGLPESGKTTLTYRFIGSLMKKNNGIKFTDDIGKDAQRIIYDIKSGKEQELAAKTAVNDVKRSIQVLVPGEGMLPYHIFINDVGGELFTTGGVDADHMQFFKNVESLCILIDPLTMDLKNYNLCGFFKTWYSSQIDKESTPIHREKVNSVFDTVRNMTNQFVNKSKNIIVNIVLVKSDLGYIEDDAATESGVREFLISQIGMEAEIFDVENSYAEVHYFAVSALKDIGIDNLIDGILDELKIKIKQI